MVGVGEAVGVGLSVGVGEFVGVGLGASVDGATVAVRVGAGVSELKTEEVPDSLVSASFVEDAIPAFSSVKEPAIMTAIKQKQVAMHPSSMRCVFFIVNLKTFLIH